MDHREDGWSQRLNVKSIAWHYFRNGTSVCAMKWGDPAGPLRPVLPPGARPCPRCTKALSEDGR